MSSASIRAEARWITRAIPLFLAGCVGFATYVVVKRVCVDHYFRSDAPSSTGVALIVPHAVLLVLVVLTYARLLLVVAFDPGLVPLGAGARREPRRRQRWRKDSRDGGRDIEAQPYDAGPDIGPDSPGLERFYSKDVFVCEPDGRPRYCSSCRAWKPDRAHHSSEIDRCVRKMDHYCPWVGGIISETSFKFFVQFTFYATLYCVVALVAAILCLRDQIEQSFTVDGTLIAVVAGSAFFGLFAFGMTLASARYVLTNLTSVDHLKYRSSVYQLAVRVPRGTLAGPNYGVVVYPLPRTDPPPAGGREGREAGGVAGARKSERPSSRDLLATRTFAVVRTEIGENPWDLGPWGNWVSVMGANVADWLLPIRMSPCVGQESNESFYRMGPSFAVLRPRYGLPKADGGGYEGEGRYRGVEDGYEGIEMGGLRGHSIRPRGG